jgi:hypothetical protein
MSANRSRCARSLPWASCLASARARRLVDRLDSLP